MPDIAYLLDDTADDPVKQSRASLPQLRFVGAGRVQVHQSGDVVQISLVEEPQPEKGRVRSVTAAATRNEKFFGCNLTADGEVTVNAGKIYVYSAVGVAGQQNLRQTEVDIRERVLPGLVDGDKIYFTTKRTLSRHRGDATIVGEDGEDTATWTFLEFQYFFGTNVVVIPASNSFPETLGGPYYWHLATYYKEEESDGGGERVVQHKDGWLDMPYVFLPNDSAVMQDIDYSGSG